MFLEGKAKQKKTQQLRRMKCWNMNPFKEDNIKWKISIEVRQSFVKNKGVIWKGARPSGMKDPDVSFSIIWNAYENNSTCFYIIKLFLF